MKWIPKRQSALFGAVALAGAMSGCGTAPGEKFASTEERVTSVSKGVDPGPRAGAASAGGAFAGLSASEQQVFNDALGRFEEIDSVSGTVEGENGVGLGPTFNGNSCAMCHAQPAVGGTSPGLASPQNPIPNPQVALATRDGARNTVPSFITANGPVREARFIAVSSANNAPLDGGVHGLFTIAGRSDAPGCTLAQPDFATQLANNNVIFRIPTPLFGLGLVENTPDATLQANLAANGASKSALGIHGRFNTSGNDGTITRFGWKAQNKSLLIFSSEAYNVEQGVSNEGFPNERSAVTGCVFNPTPEDSTNFTANGSTTGTAVQMSSDVTNFAIFARLSAPATPAPLSASATNGQALFTSIGCANCHSPSLTTAASPFTGMSNVTYHPYSDFALHHMGGNLADGISQGAAVADEFRTAPLWGVGQRLFFLHDGRTSDLGEAIEAHSNNGQDQVTTQDYEQFNANGVWFQPFTQNQTPGSEAQAVVNNYNALSAQQQTDLLNFLRTL
ncbi:MAG TPA: di-heme oxidoredictase family protein [Polyangiaceae bacterium]|nr:di-heme oxidoredictase family protein [Polyangiaceae bacterium]